MKVVERRCSGPHTANSAPFRSSTIDHCICSAGTRYLLVQTSFQMLRVVLSDLQLMSTYSTQALVSKLLTHVSTIADVSNWGCPLTLRPSKSQPLGKRWEQIESSAKYLKEEQNKEFDVSSKDFSIESLLEHLVSEPNFKNWVKLLGPLLSIPKTLRALRDLKYGPRL